MKLKAFLYIEIEKYNEASEILLKINNHSEILLLSVWANTNDSVAIKKHLKTIKCSPTLCKSKIYQNAIVKFPFTPNSDPHSIQNCFEVNKKTLGISHRKTVRSLILLAKQKYKIKDLDELFIILTDELTDMQEHIGVHSVLHPAYNIILEMLCFYLKDVGNYDKIIILYQSSIEVLLDELLVDGIFQFSSQHVQIKQWRAKIRNAIRNPINTISVEFSSINISSFKSLQVDIDCKLVKENPYSKEETETSKKVIKPILYISSPEIKSVLMKCTQKVTLFHIKDIKLGNQWKQVMRNLNISEAAIDIKKQEYYMHGLDEVVYQLLRLWIEKNGSAATLKDLSTALWKEQQHEALATLLEVYKQFNNSDPSSSRNQYTKLK